jgi:hypothetical protein
MALGKPAALALAICGIVFGFGARGARPREQNSSDFLAFIAHSRDRSQALIASSERQRRKLPPI